MMIAANGENRGRDSRPRRLQRAKSLLNLMQTLSRGRPRGYVCQRRLLNNVVDGGRSEEPETQEKAALRSAALMKLEDTESHGNLMAIANFVSENIVPPLPSVSGAWTASQK